MTERRVMTEADINRSLTRLAHEIVERNQRPEGMCLIGIRTRGVPLAMRLQRAIKGVDGTEMPLGTLDITFYRDDLTRVSEQPIVGTTEIAFPLDDRSVILVDDVLYTGRTTRAAMDALIDLGRPRRIQLAVLIDRGHRQLPIRADFVGKNIPTQDSEVVHVLLTETDQMEEVVVRGD